MLMIGGSMLGNWQFKAGVRSTMKKRERIKDRIGEREYYDRLKSSLKNDFNTELEPLKSLKTATKKRREVKRRPPLKPSTDRFLPISRR
jgi:hypothetical protein